MSLNASASPLPAARVHARNNAGGAPTRQLASAVLANLRGVLPSDELSVHPMAAAQVEP
jgi:hypothetical protein